MAYNSKTLIIKYQIQLRTENVKKMKALLDTNIIIHREASKVINQDVGILYRWLERVKYTKCVHSLTISEIENTKNQQTVDTFQIKLDSYERIETLHLYKLEVIAVSKK